MVIFILEKGGVLCQGSKHQQQMWLLTGKGKKKTILFYGDNSNSKVSI
jgi:hypothetical protein